MHFGWGSGAAPRRKSASRQRGHAVHIYARCSCKQQ
jgi:hypothetical protein